MKDHLGRPLVAVTGIGLVTPLAWGREANWAAITAGKSGISRIRRFPVDKLRTTIAGTVELPEEAAGAAPVSSAVRVERMAEAAVEEALGQAALGEPGAFPGPLMVGMPPVEMEWPQRFELARQANGSGAYPAITQVATGRADIYETFMFGGVGERLAHVSGGQARSQDDVGVVTGHIPVQEHGALIGQVRDTLLARVQTADPHAAGQLPGDQAAHE